MNGSNYFNLTIFEICEKEHDLSSLNELFTCYFYLFHYSIVESILGLVILFFACIANVLVIILILTTHKKITLFDQIIIGQSKNLYNDIMF
jgi:hypothetical protein